jgi:hypothetical protein
VFWLALLLCIPLIATAAIVPLFGAWTYGRTRTSGDVVLLGMDEFGLIMLAIAFASCVYKLCAPMAAVLLWPAGRVSAIICLVVWILGLLGCASVIDMGLLVPSVANSPERVIFLMVSWLAIDFVASLMPTALMHPSAWRIRPANDRETFHRSTARELPTTPAARTDTTHPPFDLLELLEDLAEQPRERRTASGVRVMTDGEIVTSQSALAKIFGSSKGTINRQLHALAAEGRIHLTTRPRETRIRVPRDA